MDVFISWSEDKSHHVAKKLAEWLPKILDPVKPWVSDYIGAGQAWLPILFNKLKETRVGILCFTEENVRSPWIHFEAGAVFKSVRQESLVIPYLINIGPQQLGGPLNHINAVRADRVGTKSLLSSLNAALPTSQRLDERILDDRFVRFWGDLDRELKRVISDGVSKPVTTLLKGAMTASQELSEAATRCGSLIGALERDLKSASVVLTYDSRTLRSSNEAARRLSELVNPADQSEFEKTLWWVSQRGSEVHLRAMQLLVKSPPFRGAHIRDLMKQAQKSLAKKLSGTRWQLNRKPRMNLRRRNRPS